MTIRQEDGEDGDVERLEKKLDSIIVDVKGSFFYFIGENHFSALLTTVDVSQVEKDCLDKERTRDYFSRKVNLFILQRFDDC